MIRWKYVVPRLVLLSVVLLAIWFGLNPLVRWSLVSTGQSMLGAKVEIGNVEASLLRTEIQLSDVHLADPRSPMKNLIEARQVTLALEGDPLLRRKFVVREGRISGLKIGTDRKTSGELEPGAGWDVEIPTAELAEFGEKWLEEVAEVLRRDLVEELESVRLARELFHRWPAEYEQMEARVDSLTRRIDGLNALYRSQSGDVLQDIELYQQAANELATIREEMLQLHGEIERLPQQALRDRDAIDAARRHDVEQIRRKLRLVSELDPEAISEYLLGPEMGRRVVTLARWIQWSRQYLPSGGEESEPIRGRGIDVLFPGSRRDPDFLIRSLVLDGEGTLFNERFRFRGTATGLTSQPELHGQPVVLALQVEGKAALGIEAVVDRCGDMPRERITINCPGLAQPERVLGQPGRLALAVSPGNTHLWMSVELAGDELTGQVIVEQRPVELLPQLAPEYGGPRLAESLRVATSQVRDIRVAVDLSGTLQQPRCRLHSNLGPQLAEGLNLMVRRELEVRRDELLAYVQRQLTGELARFEQTVRNQQQAAFEKLELGDAQIQELSQMVAQRIRVPEGILGKALPDGLPLRF